MGTSIASNSGLKIWNGIPLFCASAPEDIGLLCMLTVAMKVGEGVSINLSVLNLELNRRLERCYIDGFTFSEVVAWSGDSENVAEDGAKP
jgi:hypothetical protein